jgi:glutaredoxin
MTVLTLYGKPGCCLCDDARSTIDAARGGLDVELREVDVSLDPGLHAEYGERIPVVELDGEEVFELHVDPLELRRLLGTVAT